MCVSVVVSSEGSAGGEKRCALYLLLTRLEVIKGQLVANGGGRLPLTLPSFLVVLRGI